MIEVVPKQKRQEQTIVFQKFILGENTSVPASQLSPNELASCIDFKLRPGGRLETREGVVKYTGTEIGSVVDINSCSIGGVEYEICSDDDGKIYYLDGDTPTQVGTAAVGTTAAILPYNDVALVMDGGYLKYIESTTSTAGTAPTEIKLAYDSGPGGTFFDNYSGDYDSTTTITTSGVGCTFTTPDWSTDLDSTIPPTKVWFHGAAATSAGTGTISVDIVTTAGTECASVDHSGVTSTTADYYSVTFSDSDITTELSPDTEYFCLLKGSNLNLSHTTVTSGGALITAGSTPDTTKDPVMRVHPGLPPKASFGAVSGNRLWVKDPDDPGLAKFCNLTHLDWSTSDGGGWVGVVDNNKNSFGIGGFADLYGDLYVYGTEDHPYMCRLIGDTPSDYSLPLLFQQSWTTHKTLVNASNDLWSASASGVDNLSGVQEFGDLRTFSISDPVQNRFDNWVSSTAFAGYNARDGQYWLYMPTYDYVLVCHTKQSVRTEEGSIRYPWTRYDLPVTPTCFRQSGNNFLIGSSDGYIYKLDPDEYEDLSTTQIYPEWKSAYIEMPGLKSNVIQLQVMGASTYGSNVDIVAYKDGNESSPLYTWSFDMPGSDGLILDEMLMDLSDAIMALDPEESPMYFDVNFTARSFQVGMKNTAVILSSVFIHGIMAKYKLTEH